jgi:hypothetical protein
MSLLVPGIPWDIPVSAPLFARQLTQRAQENAERKAEGKDPLAFDYGRTLTDVMSYSAAFTRNAEDLMDVINESFGGPGGEPMFAKPAQGMVNPPKPTP